MLAKSRIEIFRVLASRPGLIGVAIDHSGRIRLAMIVDNSAASLEAFVRANVKPGATPLTDGHS